MREIEAAVREDDPVLLPTVFTAAEAVTSRVVTLWASCSASIQSCISRMKSPPPRIT